MCSFFVFCFLFFSSFAFCGDIRYVDSGSEQEEIIDNEDNFEKIEEYCKYQEICVTPLHIDYILDDTYVRSGIEMWYQINGHRFIVEKTTHDPNCQCQGVGFLMLPN